MELEVYQIMLNEYFNVTVDLFFILCMYESNLHLICFNVQKIENLFFFSPSELHNEHSQLGNVSQLYINVYEVKKYLFRLNQLSRQFFISYVP